MKTDNAIITVDAIIINAIITVAVGASTEDVDIN